MLVSFPLAARAAKSKETMLRVIPELDFHIDAPMEISRLSSNLSQRITHPGSIILSSLNVSPPFHCRLVVHAGVQNRFYVGALRNETIRRRKWILEHLSGLVDALRVAILDCC